MRTGSLFSGYGGLDRALDMLTPTDLAFVSDIEPGPRIVQAYHHPGVPNLGDITTVDWTAVEPVDVLAGGSPCTDMSHAGKRAGLTKDTRSGLWTNMAQAVAALRPRYVIWENVRGAFSARADSLVEPCPLCVGDEPGLTVRALGRVLGDLADIGYDAVWTTVRASDVGAPHRRERVFLLAWDQAAADTIGQAGQGWPGHGPQPAQHLRRRPAHGDHPAAPGLSLLPTPAVNDMGAAYTPATWDAWRDKMRAKHGNGNGHGPSLHIEALRMLPTPTAADAKSSGGQVDTANLTLTDAAVRAESRGVDFGQYTDAIARWEHTLGRRAPDVVRPSGRDRRLRLSAEFVEWMMGLPSGWLTATGASRSQILRMCGNGVVPQQGAYALTLLEAMMLDEIGRTR